MKTTHFPVALVAFSTLVAGGCDTTAPFVREPVPFETVLQSSSFFGLVYADGEAVPPVSIGLTSSADEAAFLRDYPRSSYQIDGGDPFYLPFPEVDYSASTAVVVTLGTTGSGSISVRVDSVVSDGRRATVYSTRVLPCVGTRDAANPAVIVALDGPGRRVEFAEADTERTPCF